MTVSLLLGPLMLDLAGPSLTDEEREAYRQAALELGMDFPADSDDDDYYE